MLHTKNVEIGLPVLEKFIFERFLQYMGMVDLIRNPVYLTTQLKSNYMSWNTKSKIDVAIMKNTFQTYLNDLSQS